MVSAKVTVMAVRSFQDHRLKSKLAKLNLVSGLISGCTHSHKGCARQRGGGYGLPFPYM